MPDLGIGEAIAGIVGGGGLDSLLGAIGLGSEAAAPAAAAAETGAATIGAGAGGAAAGGGTLADIVGTGAGLAGGTTGLTGTALAGGAGTDLSALLGTGAATAGGTAADFLSAPAASGFNASAVAPTAIGGATSIDSLGLGPGVANANASAPSSAFTSSASPVANVTGGGAPSAVPAGASAGSSAAPASVAGNPDATSITSLTGAPAPNGTVPQAAGYSSLGGPNGPAPLGGGTSVPASTSFSDTLSGLGDKALSSVTNNPLGVGLGAAGLGYSIYSGLQNTANEKALTATAQTAGANSAALEQQGQGLVNYLTSGTLPPAYQTQITQSINSAITQAKSAAAAQGLSTDPTQNTALAAQIQEIQNQQPILQEQIAAQLAGTGTSLIGAGASAAGLSGNLYQALVQNDTTQAANAGKAIASLAAALNGKTATSVGGVNISMG